MRLLEAIRQDTRYAVRLLVQNPMFAAIAILSLALGIGANTAIFTLIDTVLLRSLPVRDPGQLVVFARDPDDPSVGDNYPDYLYIRDHNKSFSGVIAYGGGWSPAAMAVPDEGAHATAQLVTATLVSGNYFEVLGVTPAIGRLLTAADNKMEDAHPWVVLDYDFWQRRFAGDPHVIGRPIKLNGSAFTIVGVARSGFTGVVVGNHPNLYLPIMMLREIQRGTGQWNNRHYWWLTILARLKPGVTMQAAIPEADLLWKQILANDPEQRTVPAFDKDYKQRNRGTLLPGSGGYSSLRNSIQKPLIVLMIVVALVLLIACANVASLLLARAAARQREIAIRLSVGAGRARLVCQLVLETLVVSLLGGILGLAFAWGGVRVLLALMPTGMVPLTLNLSPDWRLLGFSFGVALVAGLLCGIAPALQATRPDLTSALKNEAATLGRFDLRRALVVIQIAISLLLLIGAGLFVRSLRNLRSLDPGFLRESVLLVNVDPEQSGYKGQRLRQFYERLLERARSFPGVRAASLANITPLNGSEWNNTVSVEGYRWKSDEEPDIDFNAVSSGYFETLGIPILLGRDFRAQDNPAVSPDLLPHADQDKDKLGPPPPVAIINEAMAKKFFPHESPIGRHFSRGDKFDPAKSFEIVGVVKNAKYFDIRKAVQSMIYVPVWRFQAMSNTLCIRSNANPEALIAAVRREVASLDPAIPVLQTLTMEEQFDSTISQERIVTTLCGFFGSLAVLLAAIGLYGVMAHSVTHRYREIGIRMALGAQPGNVLWLVLRDTALMIAVGACIGLPAAFALTRLVSSFLFGLTPQDPLSITLATAGLIAVTALAGYIPARRATRIDPTVALRYE